MIDVKRMAALFGLLVIAGTGMAAEPAAEATVTVYPEQELGAVMPMHAVNNGPSVSKPGAEPQEIGSGPWEVLQKE